MSDYSWSHGLQHARLPHTSLSPGKWKSLSPCPALCNPMDCTFHGIVQARILECVAYPFSRGSLQPRDRTQVSWIAGKFFNWAIREIWVWICSNSCPLSQWWWHAPISSSVTPFSSCPQYFPASGSFLVTQLFASGGQNIGGSASAEPVSIKGWFPESKEIEI